MSDPLICDDCGVEQDPAAFRRARSGRLCQPCKTCGYKRGWERRRRGDAKSSPADNMRRYNLRADFGITDAEYDELLARQNGCCALCEKPETATRQGKLKKLAVDHDHATGTIRGLLCANCNRALGLFNDDAERLRRAADYVSS